MYFIWNDDRIIEHSLQLLWWHGLVWLGSAPTLQPRAVPWNPYVRYCERAVACMRSLTFFLWEIVRTPMIQVATHQTNSYALWCWRCVMASELFCSTTNMSLTCGLDLPLQLETNAWLTVNGS